MRQLRMLVRLRRILMHLCPDLCAKVHAFRLLADPLAWSGKGRPTNTARCALQWTLGLWQQ